MSLPSTAHLSPHFTARELRADLPEADATIVANLMRVALGLETVRSALGTPLRVTSGFRPPERNARVGGSSTSSHMDGLAADVVPVGSLSQFNAYERLQAARTQLAPFDQIIFYPAQGHIHVGYGNRMRREFRISFSSDPGGTPLLTGDLIAKLPGFVGSMGEIVAESVADGLEAISGTPPALVNGSKALAFLPFVVLGLIFYFLI